MTYYYVVQFESELTLDDNEQIVGTSLSNRGTRTVTSEKNLALVKVRDDSDSDVSEESDVTYECEYETDSGTCSRSVPAPDDRCWQHQN